jgi:chaperonin GroES
MITGYKATMDRILVRRDATPEKIGSILLTPSKPRDRYDPDDRIPMFGTVLQAGPGRKDKKGRFIPTEVQPNDRVMFHRITGVETEIDGELLLIMRGEDVLAYDRDHG